MAILIAPTLVLGCQDLNDLSTGNSDPPELPVTFSEMAATVTAVESDDPPLQNETQDDVLHELPGDVDTVTYEALREAFTEF